jgi:hypothetical protein
MTLSDVRGPTLGIICAACGRSGRIVAVLFTAALALLMTSLVDFTREIRVSMAHMHLE